jgi:hypothetical protein
MITVRLSAAPSDTAINLDTTSFAPPGACGTIRRIVREGQAWAATENAQRANSMAKAERNNSLSIGDMVDYLPVDAAHHPSVPQKSDSRKCIELRESSIMRYQIFLN